MRKENVIEIKEEVKVGDRILEKGDKIQIVTEVQVSRVEISRKDIVQKSKEILFKQIESIRKAGFGYVDEVLTHAIFSVISEKDFEKEVLPIFLKNNPTIVVVD